MDSRENTPDGKGRYFPPQKVKTLEMGSLKGEYTRWKGRVFPPQKSQTPENGLPAGRIHLTERAGIFHLKKIKKPEK